MQNCLVSGDSVLWSQLWLLAITHSNGQAAEYTGEALVSFVYLLTQDKKVDTLSKGKLMNTTDMLRI